MVLRKGNVEHANLGFFNSKYGGDIVKIRLFIIPAILSVMFGQWGEAQTNVQTDALPAPHFHHIHLNSVDPDAAIDFYTKQFPSTAKATLAGFPSLKAG